MTETLKVSLVLGASLIVAGFLTGGRYTVSGSGKATNGCPV